MWICNRVVFLLAYAILSVSLAAQDNNPSGSETSSIIDIEARINQMADDCWRLREINSDSALIIGKEAHFLAQEHQIAHKFPRLQNFIGVIYIHYLHDTKSAIPYFHSAIENSLIINDSVQLAYTYNNLGDAFMLTGNTPLAFQYAEKSLHIFAKLKHKIGIAYTYINYGIVYRLEKRYSLSLQYFNRAKRIRENEGDSIGLASVIWELAKTYKEYGNLDKALELYQQSYEYENTLKNLRFTAACLHGIADIHYIRKQYDLAADYYSRALELNKTRNYHYGVINDELELALVYAQQGKIEEGEALLQDALSLSTSKSVTHMVLDSYKAYTKFYQLVQNYKKASQFFNQFLILYDSVLLVQQFETLNEIENNFSINNRLNQSRQETENQKIAKKYLQIIIALMIILVGGIIWRLRANRILNQKLKLMIQTKNKMFSVISHDLKSPFNSIIGFNSLLIKELNKGNYDKTKKYADIVQNASKESLKLLTNLLNWSKTQTGRIEFNASIFLIEDLFNELRELFNSEANKFEIELEFINSAKDNISGDVDILRIILINLISNAFKYTKQKGEIRIEVSETSSHIIIKVIDNGIGMSEETKKTLFKSGHLVKSIIGLRKEVGTGLGLTICEELIKIHKGSIRVDSEIGKGSSFEITFPS